MATRLGYLGDSFGAAFGADSTAASTTPPASPPPVDSDAAIAQIAIFVGATLTAVKMKQPTWRAGLIGAAAAAVYGFWKSK